MRVEDNKFENILTTLTLNDTMITQEAFKELLNWFKVS